MRRSVLYLLLCLLLISTLIACATNETGGYVAVGDQAPFNEHRVPNYPGAQGMHVRGDGATSTSAGGYRFIYFTTGDTPTAVLSFYNEMLPKEDWSLSKDTESISGGLYFESSSKPEYQVTVWTTVMDGTATHVIVALTFHPR